MKQAAIIVAGGRGTRLGGSPKQWRLIAGKTVVAHALDRIVECGIDRVVVVHHVEDAELVRSLARAGLTFAVGGETRGESVRAGLEALASDPPDVVLIHDAARPCVSRDLIARVLAALGEADGAAPALPVTDALWTGSDRVEGCLPRDGLWRAQTPQGFLFASMLDAHRSHRGAAADDVEVARAAGLTVAIVPGDENNLKITHAPDLERAGRILEGRLDLRTGSGFDVHAFGPGSHVTLCGVEIPYGRGLIGHSDADVGLHALTDAILGAVAMGDIGQHFPPSDPRWRGVDSRVFLRHSMSLATEAGFRLNHVDVTLICEAPKIGPHRAAMLAAMADTLGLSVDRIGLKATTSEGLGFTGRGEGIAAMATATLMRP